MNHPKSNRGKRKYRNQAPQQSVVETRRKRWKTKEDKVPDESLNRDSTTLSGAEEHYVDDGAGVANRRFAVAAANWESLGGARTPGSG